MTKRHMQNALGFVGDIKCLPWQTQRYHLDAQDYILEIRKKQKPTAPTPDDMQSVKQCTAQAENKKINVSHH